MQMLPRGRACVSVGVLFKMEHICHEEKQSVLISVNPKHRPLSLLSDYMGSQGRWLPTLEPRRVSQSLHVKRQFSLTILTMLEDGSRSPKQTDTNYRPWTPT